MPNRGSLKNVVNSTIDENGFVLFWKEKCPARGGAEI